MKLDLDVLNKIKEGNFREVCIITNQGGVSENLVDKNHWLDKIKYVCACIREYASVFYVTYKVCYSNSKDDIRRKPNPGMVEEYIKNMNPLTIIDDNYKEQILDKCLMVGDASGLPGQFSDSDKRCAENAGIDYMDVADFKKNYDKRRYLSNF